MDWLYFWPLVINSNIYPFIHQSCKIVSLVVLHSGLRGMLGEADQGEVAVGASFKRFDSHGVTLSKNSDACFSLDFPSPSAEGRGYGGMDGDDY